jgi:hypothetical protein
MNERSQCVSAAQRIKEETEQILCEASKVITMAGRGVLSTPRRDNYRTITRITYRSPNRTNYKIDPLGECTRSKDNGPYNPSPLVTWPEAKVCHQAVMQVYQ